MRRSFYSLSFQELSDELRQFQLHPSGAKLLYKWHMKEGKTEKLTKDLSLKTQKHIEENFSFTLPKIKLIQKAEDETTKLLFSLEDESTVECVLIPFLNKYTLCLSSQVGCAMKCSFCYTGTQGLKRHLTTEEIIGLFIASRNYLYEIRKNEAIRKPLKNIVFMGQGEPLHNFDQVKKAIEIFLEENGICLGIQKITLSTAGYLPGLIRFKTEMPSINIALSLHSLNTNIRNTLIPINQKYPLEEVLKIIYEKPLLRKQYVTLEYLLIKDLNDAESDAHQLAQTFKDTKTIINLIPFNPIPGSDYQRPTFEKVKNFRDILDSYKIAAIIRGTKGDEILAACGQLNSKVSKV